MAQEMPPPRVFLHLVGDDAAIEVGQDDVDVALGEAACLGLNSEV